jgi:hypothetical protein
VFTRMSLPFQTTKTFITTLSKDDIIEFVRERLNRRDKFLFISSREYIGSINGRTFKFHRIFNFRSSPAYPKISGVITASDPTILEITITPHYFRILFFLIFPMVFIPSAFLTDHMTINGVFRAPELSERVSFALFGGVGPLIWCYFDSIRPIRKTELWLKEHLNLTEKTTYQR